MPSKPWLFVKNLNLKIIDNVINLGRNVGRKTINGP